MRDQETKSRKREEGQRERLERLEEMVFAQHKKLDKLEDLVYRVMHRDRVGLEGGAIEKRESPEYEGERSPGHNDLTLPPDLPAASKDNHHQNISQPYRTKPYYSISSV